MGYIKKLKNNELVGGTDKHTIYPVTSTKAVFEEVTEGDKSSFKSQETINGEHDDRIKGLENEMPDTIKSITINGGQRVNTVDENGNVDLTIYSDGGQDYEGLTEVVADLRDIVGENPEEPQSGTLLERVDTLEEAVGTGGSVDQRISSAIGNINAEHSDIDPTDHIQYQIVQNNGEITDLTIQGVDIASADALEALRQTYEGLSRTDIIIQDTAPTTGDEGVIYRVTGETTYTDYMFYNGQRYTMATYDIGNLDPQVSYYTCTTQAATPAKAATGTDASAYALTLGGHFKVEMDEANTATSGVTLQVGSATAKELMYNGAAVDANNTWEDGEVLAVYYYNNKYWASNAQGGGGKAEKIKYDNSNGLPADNVQGALDIAANVLYSDEKTEISLSNSSDTYVDGVAIAGSPSVWTATSSSHTYRCHIIPVNEGEVYEIVGRTDSNTCNYAWLTSDSHTVGQTPSYLTGYEQNYIVNAGDVVKVTVPAGANFLYISRVINGNARFPSLVAKLYFIKDDVNRLNTTVYGTGYKDGETYTVASNSTSIINSTLKIANNSYTKSMFVELKNARAFTITANADNGTYYAFTSKTIENGDMVGALLPTDHERHFIAANKTAYIDNIPEGAVYLYLLLIASNQTRFSPQSIMIHTGVDTGVESVESKVENVGAVDEEPTTYTVNQSLVLQHYPARLGIIGSECLWINNSLGQHHILIPAGNASEITVTANDDNASYYAFLADDLFVSGVSPMMAIGETKRYDIAAGETSVLEVPESTQWIAFNASGADGINLLPSSVVVTAINSNYSPKKTSEIDTISENAAATKAILGDYEYTDGDMNLQIVKAGREHGASCYWWYPAIIWTRTPYKRIYHVYCDEHGSSGIACVNPFDKRSWKVILKNLKRDGEVDLHSIMSVYRVPSGNDEGKLVCAYSEGHNQTNWLHIRISKNPDDITEWNEHISVNLGALATYSQFHYVNGRYYIFSRTDSGATWGYLYSDDLINWSDYHVLIEQDESVDRKYFYIWLKPIADEPNMLRFISYGHPIRYDTGIRCGVIDFETGNVYDYVDMETPLGTLTDRFSNAAFTTLIEHPNETTKGRQRMYDLAVTELDSLKIVYGRQKLGTQTDGNYFVYEVDYQTLHDAEVKTQAGTRTELCQTGLCFLDHSDTHAANGICFLDENTVFVSRSSQDYVGYDYMEIYKKTEGVWAFEKEVYKELKGAELLRNGYPIASPDGKYVMWMRGLVRLDQFEDAQTDLILYDVENDVIF